MLEVLTEISPDGECAPYNAETIEFLLSQKCGKDNININQINRTLRDLVKLGLVTYELREVRYSGTLPKKVRYYQAVEGKDRRRLWRETNEVIREANNSRGTVEMFKGATEPFSKEQVGLLVDRVDKLVEKLTEGNTDEYRSWVRNLLEMKDYALSNVDGIALWHKRNKENQSRFV
jgi:DNA-binding PadR family transcriptional regulator